VDDPRSQLALVLGFVRGAVPWRELQRVGLSISFMDDGCECDGAGSVVAKPSLSDVSVGFTRLRGESAVALRNWACVMLAASSVIDLCELETHTEGERVLAALWDASAGVTLESNALATIARLAVSDGRQV